MSALFDAARDLQKALESRGRRFCLIGGLAVLRWGEPRFTRDVLEAAGEGAILAGQAEPHCECSMAVSGDGMA